MRWACPLGRPARVAAAAAVLLSGCAVSSPGGQSQTDASTRAACQQRAEQVYEQQNRAEIYSPPAPVNSPYSANYTPSVSDRGLSNLFVHDRMVSDCVRNTGTGIERNPPSPLPGH